MSFKNVFFIISNNLRRFLITVNDFSLMQERSIIDLREIILNLLNHSKRIRSFSFLLFLRDCVNRHEISLSKNQNIATEWNKTSNMLRTHLIEVRTVQVRTVLS